MLDISLLALVRKPLVSRYNHEMPIFYTFAPAYLMLITRVIIVALFSFCVMHVKLQPSRLHLGG